MKINEYGTENNEILLMFPPLGVKSDVYDFVRPSLEKRYHIMVVSYPGVDGGMTPYELPKPITYLIGIRDFLMISSAKLLGPKVLREVMNPDKFSDQDAVYMKECIGMMSSKTIWRCFYSANNYKLDLPIQPPKGKAIYWYGEEEKKDRAWDIKYIEKHMPWAELVENQGVGHAEFFTLYPERFVEQLEKYINGEVR